MDLDINATCFPLELYHVIPKPLLFSSGLSLAIMQVDGEPVPVGVHIETAPTTVTKQRYEFMGAARLGEANYRVSGYEDAAPNLGYLSPQYLPPLGSLMAQLRDETGADTLCISATVRYDSSEGFLGDPQLFSGSCLSPQPYTPLKLDRKR